MFFQEALLSLDTYFDYLSQKGEFPPSQKRPRVVLFIQQKAVMQHILSQNVHHWGKEFLSKVAFLDRSDVAICGGFGLGAPALAIKLEELIFWGVRCFVHLGVATRLTSEVSMHSIAYAERVFGIDGVSKFYADSSDGLQLDKEFQSLFESFQKKYGIKSLPSSFLSSDLFFSPESIDQNDQNHNRAHLLDLEAAALYAIAKKRDVKVLSISVVSDALASSESIPGFDPEATLYQLKQAADLAFSFCSECS